MREGWKEVKFGEVVEFPPKIKMVKGNKYPFIPMELIDGGYKYVKPIEEKELAGGGTKFEEGDTLFARITPCLQNGKIAQAKNLNNKPGFGSTEYFIFRGIPNVTDNDYVYYLSQMQEFRDNAINSMVGASGRQRADAGHVKSFVFNLPPLETQKKIASILSGYDDLIENNLKRIKLLEEMAQHTYEEWFVRMRFPGHQSATINPETGLPEGWGKVKLGDYINFKKGKKLEETFEEKLPETEKVLLLDSLESGKFNYTKIGNHSLVKRGDILMLMDGARSSYVFLADNGVIGSTMAKVETKNLPSSLLFYYFQKNLEWLQINNTGAAIPHANPNFIKKIDFKMPNKELLDNWELFIQPIWKKLWNLKDQNQRLREARDILLPRLMMGMVEV